LGDKQLVDEQLVDENLLEVLASRAGSSSAAFGNRTEIVIPTGA
jgi:hypothetical protein